jgi:hypothetical protein
MAVYEYLPTPDVCTYASYICKTVFLDKKLINSFKLNNVKFTLSVQWFFEFFNEVHILGQGLLTEGGRLSTVDLLIKIACFVEKKNNISNLKMR